MGSTTPRPTPPEPTPKSSAEPVHRKLLRGGRPSSSPRTRWHTCPVLCLEGRARVVDPNIDIDSDSVNGGTVAPLRLRSWVCGRTVPRPDTEDRLPIRDRVGRPRVGFPRSTASLLTAISSRARPRPRSRPGLLDQHTGDRQSSCHRSHHRHEKTAASSRCDQVSDQPEPQHRCLEPLDGLRRQRRRPTTPPGRNPLDSSVRSPRECMKALVESRSSPQHGRNQHDNFI